MSGKIKKSSEHVEITDQARPETDPQAIGASALNSSSHGVQLNYPKLTPLPPMEVPAKYNRQPRTPFINNGVGLSRGGAKIQIPDPSLIAEIQASEPRVRHFGIANTDEFLDSPLGHMSDPDIYDLVMRPFSMQVAQDYPGRRLAMRGIKTSINGAIPVNEAMTVLDIEDVVDAGEEKLNGWFRAGGFAPEAQDPIHYHVARYASDTDYFRTKVEDGSGRSAAVFPAILVYDADQLAFASSGYGTSFQNILKASQAVVAAYVLDCPVM